MASRLASYATQLAFHGETHCHDDCCQVRRRHLSFLLSPGAAVAKKVVLASLLNSPHLYLVSSDLMGARARGRGSRI